MRALAVRRSAAFAFISLALALWACGDATTPAGPSPAAISTAEALSRPIRFPAAYSTTPEPDDRDRDEPITLSGRLFGHGKAGVILAHMRPADQTSWFSFAAELAATGDYTVLTFDFRGFGESSGEKEFNRVDTDLAAALKYVREELGIEKVFLVGASMGGTASLLVAAREHVAGVVSVSSPAVYLDIDALAVVSLIKAPKLFITSEDDVPAQRSQEQFWAQAGEPKEQEIFEGDAHGTDLFGTPAGPRLTQLLRDFLANH
ncbi:MAG: alpha/beta fold hydrolase [Chloroflexi bacterium]|nr:alpha/beta fold hydrolase [Chloroflexota bacterium]